MALIQIQECEILTVPKIGHVSKGWYLISIYFTFWRERGSEFVGKRCGSVRETLLPRIREVVVRSSRSTPLII